MFSKAKTLHRQKQLGEWNDFGQVLVAHIENSLDIWVALIYTT